MKRKSLVTLKSYRITLTTSWESNHGISGHLFEMIEYFYHLRYHKNKSVCILIADGITKEQFNTALNKYDFTTEELQAYEDHVHFYYSPKALIANDIIFVDGSLRTFDADIICRRKIFLRCSDDEFLNKADIVLQDHDLYDPLPNSIHYKKKLLLNKFKPINHVKNGVAAIYCTSNMRRLTPENLTAIADKYSYNHYIVLTNIEMEVPQNMELIKVPALNFYELFDTFIYTGSTNKTKIDCSPRLIVECKHYNKDVVYDGVYDIEKDKGLLVRRKDLEEGIDLDLKETDELTTLATF